MLDGTSLSDYKLTDGSKLNLVVKRRENNIASLPSTTNSTETNLVSSKPSSSPSTAQKPIAPNSTRQMSSSNGKSQSSKPQTLDDELRRVLRPYFNTATDTQKVVTAFKQVGRFCQTGMSLILKTQKIFQMNSYNLQYKYCRYFSDISSAPFINELRRH